MGKYIKVISNYPAYALMTDKRGFVSQLYGGANNHTGYDTAGNSWDNPVCAIMDGTVTQVYYSDALGWVVMYQSGTVKIAYYHLKKATVSVGQAVVTGKTKIGIEGSTGSLAKGQKHLHISVWVNGKLVDPEPYLLGTKKLTAAKKEEEYMIRKVIKPLNLRSTRSLANNSNLVYQDMPIGTIILVTKTVTEGNVTWGKVYTVIDGKTYAGWSNIATQWSTEI